MPHYRFRQHDSTGSIRLWVGEGLASTIASAAIVLVARNANGDLVFDDGPATAESVADAPGSTKKAFLSFALTAESVAVPGIYHGHFEATYPGGATQRLPAGGSLSWEITPDYAALDESPEAVSSAGFLQTQTAHGFAAGDAVYHDATGWHLARADDAATLAAALVLGAPDANTFRVAYLTGQEVTLPSHGKGAAGTLLYLSAETDGLVTSSAPAAIPGNLIQRLGRIKDLNTLILWPHPAEPAA